MSEMLDKMRTKPDAVKNKIAIAAAALITLSIVSVWMFVLKKPKTVETASEESTRSDLKPLFLIFKKAKTEFKDIKSNTKTYKAASAESTTSVIK